MVGRIVIPIHNVKGELVAYAGRWPGESPEDTEKYKLPPKFNKLSEVFNLDRAIKEPADNPLVIVEGFFDVIKLHQHGCRKVVAIMGNTLSSERRTIALLGIAQRQIRIKFSQKTRKPKYDKPLPDSIKTVADWIQVKRREKNLTPGHLAAKMGIATSFVLSWEDGNSQPDYRQLEALANLLESTSNLTARKA